MIFSSHRTMGRSPSAMIVFVREISCRPSFIRFIGPRRTHISYRSSHFETGGAPTPTSPLSPVRPHLLFSWFGAAAEGVVLRKRRVSLWYFCLLSPLFLRGNSARGSIGTRCPSKC